MASDVNSNTIVGRMTKDSELKYTNSGMAVATLSIANNYSRKQGDQWTEEVNYFDVKLWGKRAESLDQYLKKGTQIAITGELRQERWEQDGQKRSKVIINASNIQLLGGNQSTNNNSSNQSQGNNSSNKKPSYENYPSGNQGGNGNFEDDIPF